MPSPAARTPRETVELLLRTTVEGTRGDLAGLYAPDAVVEMPFTRPTAPSRPQDRGDDTGDEAPRTRTAPVEGLWTYDRVDGVRLHETADPEVVIAEFRVHGHLAAGQEPFTLGYINVIRVVDGLIVSSRDYNNPLESEALLSAASRPVDS